MNNMIDEYINNCSEEVQGKLRQLRQLIKEEAPMAEERISYQMPTFYLNGNLVHFAAQKRHIGFYPAPSAIVRFSEELKQYKTSKGAIQFPMEEELPQELIRAIVRFRVEENLEKGKKR